VLVHGSGPGTRLQYPIEVDRFARHGIATLAFDKRGVGESTGDWRRADFDELAEDVLAGVRFLRRGRRIRADKVGLWGVSQAGWVIPLAAARSEDVAFLVPISGGAVTPAEQELWRQRQNLAFLGVPARFIALERRAAALAYDWEQQTRLGRMPIPQPFADDKLNMFHDAPAVLRRVRQPVLAILGGMDTLTPPRESAALWAEALRGRGDDDYSVRLFPRGSHGLWDGGKTGSPLELLS
jgi:pimeloyl-ACP methyl ester carboxylesterase